MATLPETVDTGKSKEDRVKSAWRNYARAIIEGGWYDTAITGDDEFFSDEDSYFYMYSLVAGIDAEEAQRYATRLKSEKLPRRGKCWNNQAITVFFLDGSSREFRSVLHARVALGVKDRRVTIAHEGAAPLGHVIHTRLWGDVAIFKKSEAPTYFNFPDMLKWS